MSVIQDIECEIWEAKNPDLGTKRKAWGVNSRLYSPHFYFRFTLQCNMHYFDERTGWYAARRNECIENITYILNIWTCTCKGGVCIEKKVLACLVFAYSLPKFRKFTGNVRCPWHAKHSFSIPSF
jgi:hypothetical protein